MIVAAGLTPAWQHILVFDRLRSGEVNRARDVHWCASGKVLNAVLALHHLGAESRAVTLLGGDPGSAIEAELASLGISRRTTPSRSPTRVCTTLVSRPTSGGEPVITELVEEAGALGEGEYDAFLRAYAEEAGAASAVVLIGSLPRGVSKGFYRELLERTPCPAVIDARGEELLRALELRPFVIKPNREELARTLGRELRSDRDLRDAVREMQQRGAQWTVVTRGAGTVVIGGPDGGFYRIVPPPSPVVNPIGCGDCLAGGIAWAIGAGKDALECVRWGVASALDNLGRLLPGRLDPDRVAAAAASLEVEPLAG